MNPDSFLPKGLIAEDAIAAARNERQQQVGNVLLQLLVFTPHDTRYIDLPDRIRKAVAAIEEIYDHD